MKPVRVYEYKGCGTCRKAIAYLEAKGVPFERIPIRDQPPSLEELKQMLEILQGNLKKLFNTSGGDYKEMNLKEVLPTWTEKQALEALSSHGNLVKRPFALHGKNGVIGFKEPEWATFLDQMR
jgi:arsenate reductase